MLYGGQQWESGLYSILTRTTNLVSDTTVNAALNYYSYSESTITLGDFIRQNPTLVVAVGLVILALIVIIIIQRRLIDAQRKANYLILLLAYSTVMILKGSMTDLGTKKAIYI